jgi:methionyl aminopeptidase
MNKTDLKTPEEIEIMAEGGKLLGKIRNAVVVAVKPGIRTMDLEVLACEEIQKAGGKASFKMVSGYHHATCININEVGVHGIPAERIIVEGDKVGIDVGMFYKGFHTDTATTVVCGRNPEVQKFLEVGKLALKKAIEQAKPGKQIADISRAMQEVIESSGYSAVRALTGHGVGRQLHEQPAIPCFDVGDGRHSPTITPGMVLAIEVMYNEGGMDVEYKNDDGWTIVTADGKISGLFEQTVAVTSQGTFVLT